MVYASHSGNCSVAVELARYIEWFLTSVQAEDEVVTHLMAPNNPGVERFSTSVQAEDEVVSHLMAPNLSLIHI